MHRYTIAKRLGDGTYGEVVRAINKQSGEVRKIVVQIMDKATLLMRIFAANLPSLLGAACMP
jgi:serine/threonine protein kinase